MIAVIDRSGTERAEVEDNLRDGAKEVLQRVPVLYRDAVVTIPEVRSWVGVLVSGVDLSRPFAPISSGRSLVLSGPTGVGKTHNAYGAVRAVAVSGARCSWFVVNSADMFASLRPNSHRDCEDTLDYLKGVTVLVVDDLGSAKGSEWTEEVLYRLMNHRSENLRPTIITTNMDAGQIKVGLSDRVFSRIAGMSEWVSVKGTDHRLGVVR